ncbi:MAG: RsmD family RNA methyltransferase [Lentimicrobium sp.]|jgi:16S rRNA (guanine(966)-N(2))-methyltransferase RsmD|nr:RsmD family RNA methyltransferase [Lentimicrobium sp.]MDY0342426.1 RsmD family RNA methyltransferase [Lentimicrobium sp.]
MRIVSGTHKSRHIHAPKNLPVRPTTDIAKEAIFNVLVNHFDLESVNVLDLFAGTGNISYEFASRGAAGITSVDNNLYCVDFIRKIASDLGFGALLAFRADAFRYLANTEGTYDIIFCDPPFDMEEVEAIPGLVFEHQRLKLEGWLIVEHSRDHDFSQFPHFYQLRKYGKVNFSIFRESE